MEAQKSGISPSRWCLHVHMCVQVVQPPTTVPPTTTPPRPPYRLLRCLDHRHLHRHLLHSLHRLHRLQHLQHLHRLPRLHLQHCLHRHRLHCHNGCRQLRRRCR